MAMIFQRVKLWTEEEEKFLKDNYLKMDNYQLAECMDRTSGAIKDHLHLMGLQRPDPKFHVNNKGFKRMTKKIPFSQIKKEFEERDYILLSDESEYKNGSSKLRYICKKHKDKGELAIDYNHFKTGRGCMHCGRERTAGAKRSKVTTDEDKQLCELKGFEYVKTEKDENNNLIYIYFICPNHRELGVQRMRRGNMNREFVKGCQYCIDRNLPEWYVKKKIHENYPNLTVVSTYQGMYKDLTCYCSIHNEYFTNPAKQIYHWGYGCTGCTGDNRGSARKLSVDEVERRLKNSVPTLKPLNLEDYNNHDFKVKFECKECGYIFYSDFAYASTIGVLCPKCSMRYHGEQKVRDYLLDNNIDHISQYSFNDCRGNKNPLVFDFAIFNDDKLYGLIEYQGEGHYMPVKYFGGQERYEQQVKYDNIKRNYCRKNNIPLLEIPYTEFDNIYKILSNFINI